MFYCPGNTGTMYGKNIKFKEFVLEREKWIVFICGEETKTVKTSLSAIRYINSPLYEINDCWLIFTRPKPFELPPWGYEKIAHTNLLKNYLFEANELKFFTKCFGDDYLRTGKIISARDAIGYINTSVVRDWRLEMAICNYILEKEWDRIHLYENREIEPYTPRPVNYVSLAPFRKMKNTDCPLKVKLAEFYPVFKKNVHNNLFYVYSGSKHAMSRAGVFSGLIYVFDDCWPANWPLAISGNKITLARPPPAILTGTPWPFRKNYDCKINDIDCHLEVLKARGGELFSSITGNMQIAFDVTNLISFIYNRVAAITNGKTELAIARFVMNAEYESYVLNWFMANDIFHYYRYK